MAADLLAKPLVGFREKMASECGFEALAYLISYTRWKEAMGVGKKEDPLCTVQRGKLDMLVNNCFVDASVFI